MIARWRIVGLLGMAVGSFVLGVVLARTWQAQRLPRPDTTRVQACLAAYIDWRESRDPERLRQALAAADISPVEFEQTIDRMLFFQTNQASMRQARAILSLYQAGNLEPGAVAERSDVASVTLRVDAQCVQLMIDRPDLIKRAFGKASRVP